MTYTLNELAEACRTALRDEPASQARKTIVQHVRRALRDETFLATHLGPEATAERNILYEDPDYGFCICAHVYVGEKNGAPHDHGPTWAIYGQAAGVTEMTDWTVTEPAGDTNPARVTKTRTYSLNPGDAHLYDIGDVHAPMREGPTKLLRIEGKNTDHVRRTPMVPA